MELLLSTLEYHEKITWENNTPTQDKMCYFNSSRDRRNIEVGNLPELIFPYGNSGVGICIDCKIKGYAGCLCPNYYKELV